MSEVNIGVSIRAEDYEELRTDEYDRIVYDICSSCLWGTATHGVQDSSSNRWLLSHSSHLAGQQVARGILD